METIGCVELCDNDMHGSVALHHDQYTVVIIVNNCNYN